MNDWNEAERRFERALELVQQRKWPQALAELRAAASINPYNGAWLFNIGLILDEMDRRQEALETYRRAAEIEPDNLHLLERLGMDLIHLGRLRQALRVFQRMESIDRSYEPSYCHRILIYGQLGEHERAEEMFYTARLYQDHCPRCYDHMGRSLAARGEYDKAIHCLQKCLDLDGAWPDARRRLAEVSWSKKDLEQARRHYLADLRERPGRVQTLLELGDLLMEMGQAEEADEKYRRCIELAPGQAAGHYRHGRWLARRGKPAEARIALNQALQLDPSLGGVHLELARLAFRRGDRPAARKHLRAEHLLRHDDPITLLGLANLWMDCGQDQTAIACLKRLLQLQPANRDAWLNLAVAQFRRGLYSQGIASCRRALAPQGVKDKAGLLAMYNLALAHEHLHQYGAALQWARRASDGEPRDLGLQRLQWRLRIFGGGWAAWTALRRIFHPHR
jgi:tetratricopeptide (TPR) repeat protein